MATSSRVSTSGYVRAKNEFALHSSAYLQSDPNQYGFGLIYTRFLRPDKKVFQPYLRLQANHDINRSGFGTGIVGEDPFNSSGVTAMAGVRVYPFKEGLHLDVGVGAGPEYRHGAVPSMSKWAIAPVTNISVGYDIPLRADQNLKLKRRVRADMKKGR